jgi:hypothetical protein
LDRKDIINEFLEQLTNRIQHEKHKVWDRGYRGDSEYTIKNVVIPELLDKIFQEIKDE